MLEEIQFVFDMTHMVALPFKTPEGYNILVYRLSDSDPSKMHFGNAVKAFCMFNDVRISEDVITEGYVVVFDMKGLRFGHLARVQFGPLRMFMQYIQEAHPVRLKRIYVVHTSFFINQIMTLVKPLIRHELLSLLKFTSSGPADVLPAELLPVDYGGPLERLEKMHKKQRRMLETKYRQWLIDSARLKEIPKEERGKTATTTKVSNTIGASNKLEFD
ncbi:unnamed protein product [Hermetia illucens]|uniref:CRAL-TRIO domain-containing protein n=2 Tax=Hermetia illucens TaxID=343691 RepID=A0A7R8Z0S4_HERIL|nr:unnamed protein product [Hermetia illucens]